MRTANEHAGELLNRATEELELALEFFEDSALELKDDVAAHELRRLTKLNLARLYWIGGDTSAAQAVVDDVVRDDRGKRQGAEKLGPQLEALYDSRVQALEQAGHARLHVDCQRPCEILINEQPSPAHSQPLPLGTYRVLIVTTKGKPVRTTYEIDLVKPGSLVEIQFPPTLEPTPPRPATPPPAAEQLDEVEEAGGAEASRSPAPGVASIGAPVMSFDEATATLEQGLELAKEDPSAARPLLRAAVDALEHHPKQLADDPYVQRLRTLGLLSLATISGSNHYFQEALRCSLGAPLPVMQFGPSLRERYQNEFAYTRPHLGVVMVECEVLCRIYINENQVPNRIEGVPEGIYRVYAESLDGSLAPKSEELRIYGGVTTLVSYGRPGYRDTQVTVTSIDPPVAARPLPPLPPLHDKLASKHRPLVWFGATTLAAGGMALALAPLAFAELDEPYAAIGMGVGGGVSMVIGTVVLSYVSIARRKAR